MSWYWSAYKGVKAARKNSIPNYKYEDLKTTPYLYGSQYLADLYRCARTDDQKEMIYNYMEEHDVVTPEYDGYFALSEEIDKDFEKMQPTGWSLDQKNVIKFPGMVDEDDPSLPF